ncbi:MAG: hypothetical protein KDB00_12720, partial [Planctomycetales bacterium]|nr:hypothetical protein [Planctomycetales bacterium]
LESFQYFDAAGQLVATENELDGVTIYEYDLTGNLTHERFYPAANDLYHEQNNPTGLKQRHVEYEYDLLGRRRATTVHGTNPIQSFTDYFLPSDTTAGWDMVVTDPNGGQSAVLQDSLGQVVLTVQPDPGMLHDATNPAMDMPITLISYEYDTDNLSTIITSTLSVGTAAANSLPVVDADYSEIRKTRQRLDDAGRLVRAEEEVAGNFIIRQIINHDASGRVKRTVDGDGNVTRYLYDDRVTGTGQANAIYYSNSSASNQFRQFDSAGNLIKQSNTSTFDGRNTRSYTVDALGRTTSETIQIDTVDANGNSTGQITASRIWTYQGLTTQYTDRDGRITSTTFNPATRTQTESHTNSDLETYTSTTTLHSDGSVLSLADELKNSGGSVLSSSSISYLYDENGRRTQESTSGIFAGSNIPATTIGLTYEPDGQLSQISRSLAGTLISQTNYTFDDLGRVQTVFDNIASSAGGLWIGDSAGEDKSITFKYNADGQISSLQRYKGDVSVAMPQLADRGHSEYTYFDDGRIEDLQHFEQSDNSPTAFATYATTFNGAGRVQSQTTTLLHDDAHNLDEFVNISTSFEYDEKGQLEKTIVTDQTGTGTPETRQITYDDSGNRNTTSLYDNRIYKVVDGDTTYTYEYDKEGNVTKITSVYTEHIETNDVISAQRTVTEVKELDWDHRGRLSQIDTLTTNALSAGPTTTSRIRVKYAYDALNRRTGQEVTKYASDTQTIDTQEAFTYVYDPTGLVMETQLGANDSFEVSRHYFNGIPQSGLLAVDQTDASSGFTTTAWTFADKGGNVAVVGSATGAAGANPVWNRYIYQFDSHGNIEKQDGTEGVLQDVPIIWRGLQFEETTGYFWTGTTAVNPQTGRFLNQAARGENPYTFAANNPVGTASLVDDGDYGAPDPYSNWFYRAYGETFRSVVGDEYLAQATDFELGAIIGTSLVAGYAAGSVGLAYLGTSALGVIGTGALAGAAEYAAISGTASALDAFDSQTGLLNGGGYSVAAPTLGGFAQFTVGGAIGGGVAFAGGTALRAGGRALWNAGLREASFVGIATVLPWIERVGVTSTLSRIGAHRAYAGLFDNAFSFGDDILRQFADDFSTLRSIRRYVERLVYSDTIPAGRVGELVEDFRFALRNNNRRLAGTKFHELVFRFAEQAFDENRIRGFYIEESVLGRFNNARIPDFLAIAPGRRGNVLFGQVYDDGFGLYNQIYDLKPFRSDQFTYDLTDQFLDFRHASGRRPIAFYYNLRRAN